MLCILAWNISASCDIYYHHFLLTVLLCLSVYEGQDDNTIIYAHAIPVRFVFLPGTYKLFCDCSQHYYEHNNAVLVSLWRTQLIIKLYNTPTPCLCVKYPGLECITFFCYTLSVLFAHRNAMLVTLWRT